MSGANGIGVAGRVNGIGVADGRRWRMGIGWRGREAHLDNVTDEHSVLRAHIDQHQLISVPGHTRPPRTGGAPCEYGALGVHMYM